MHIALVSMPWRRPNNAAIGLALLKSQALAQGARRCDVLYANDWWFRFLQKRLPSTSLLASASYNEMARVISELAGVMHSGEWMFVRDTFPDSVPDLTRFEDLFRQAADTNAFKDHITDFMTAAEAVPDFLGQCEQSVDWLSYDVVGFSAVFYQLGPSLALAKRLRKSGYRGEIVFGGPLCEGVVGRKLLELFPFVDFVFDGESDNSFAQYVYKKNTGTRTSLPGVWIRQVDGSITQAPHEPVKLMDSLPDPDYADFFAEVDREGPLPRRELAFPIEGSRGCWWGERHHCIFCGLNGADMSYRHKSSEKVYSEIERLVKCHGIQHFAFTDNIVSPKVMKPLLEKLQKDNLGITFHAEIKANLNRSQVQSYRAAGFIYLQPGIESLSSQVLKIMDKGISALENIACLKYCREAGITAFWNLLHAFPGEKVEDYEKTIELLPALVHLNPPEVVTAMRLTRFSPSFNHSDRLGFYDKRPAGFFKYIFPFPEKDLVDLVNSFEYSFNDDFDRRPYVAEIERFAARWREERQRGHLVYDAGQGHSRLPSLTDSRFTRRVSYYELSPAEDLLIRLADRPREEQFILEHLHAAFGCAAEDVQIMLKDLKEKLFLVEEAGSWLSVAIHDDRFIPWQAIAALDQMDEIDGVMSGGLANTTHEM